MKIAAAAFSLALYYGDNGENKIQHFSNLTLRKTYSIGISTAQLSFSTPKPFIAPRAAKIRLVGSSVVNTTDYFISSRTLSGGIYTINALDRNAFLDEDLILTAEDEEKSFLSVSTFCEKLKSALGYTQVYGVPSWLQQIPIDEVKNKTFAAVMQMIADAAYGTWCCRHGEVLEFVPFGYYTERVGVEKHTALDVSDTPYITGLYITDGEGNTVTRGTGTHKYEALQLESTLYSCNDGYIEDLEDRVLKKKNNFDANVDKSAMCCATAILSDIPDTVSIFDFDEYKGRSFEVKDIQCNITSNGIFATLSNNNGTDEIQTSGKITRALNDKVDYGKVGRNAVLTKFQGYCYCEEKEPGEKE